MVDSMDFFNIFSNFRVKKLVRSGLILGKNVHIGEKVILDPSFCWLISIGDECTIADGVIILAHDASTKRHIGFTRISNVTIGRRTFIGAGSIILPGVTVGENVIIGAGSVVTHDIPNNSVVVGNPAGIIQSTNDYIETQKLNLDRQKVYSRSWTSRGGINHRNKRLMRKEINGKNGFVK